jgi:ferritin-like protein
MLGSTQHRFGRSRRSFLGAAAGVGVGLLGGTALGPGAGISDAAISPAEDRRIFKFALLLEYLQAAFYTEASRHGALRGELRTFAETVGAHERAHVAFLRSALGAAADPRPPFHFGDATRDERRFGAAARELENLGVAAYNGQGAKLTAKAMSQAAEIVSVEGRHAAWISDIVGADPAPRAADPGVSAEHVMARLKATGFLG